MRTFIAISRRMLTAAALTALGLAGSAQRIASAAAERVSHSARQVY